MPSDNLTESGVYIEPANALVYYTEPHPIYAEYEPVRYRPYTYNISEVVIINERDELKALFNDFTNFLEHKVR